MRDRGGSGAIHDQRADRFRDEQQFINAQPALVAELPAIFAAHALAENRRVDLVLGKTNLPAGNCARPSAAVVQVLQIVRTRRCAMIASTEDATRKGSMPMSIKRVKALGASFVCSVEKTK